MGASRYGGRWNHRGTPVIYSAETRALCALEVLVNSEELADDYVSIATEIPNDLSMRVVAIADLPTGWNSNPAIDATRDIGTDWAKGLTTAVLSVPSTVIPRETRLHSESRSSGLHTDPFFQSGAFLFR
jgi:RES domain-containing protein